MGIVYLQETTTDCLQSFSKTPRPAPNHKLQIYIPAKNVQRKLVSDQRWGVDVASALAL